ncbi:hypothetical protein K440DRAFT_638814 [Wilcoxina mikolae CBS 423.85]|nr:hypothetical protein K440DRAFT_638814 [Wilcoxina mikolae CBS 423.85]
MPLSEKFRPMSDVPGTWFRGCYYHGFDVALRKNCGSWIFKPSLEPREIPIAIAILILALLRSLNGLLPDCTDTYADPFNSVFVPENIQSNVMNSPLMPVFVGKDLTMVAITIHDGLLMDRYGNLGIILANHNLAPPGQSTALYTGGCYICEELDIVGRGDGVYFYACAVNRRCPLENVWPTAAPNGTSFKTPSASTQMVINHHHHTSTLTIWSVTLTILITSTQTEHHHYTRITTTSTYLGPSVLSASPQTTAETPIKIRYHNWYLSGFMCKVYRVSCAHNFCIHDYRKKKASATNSSVKFSHPVPSLLSPLCTTNALHEIAWALASFFYMVGGPIALCANFVRVDKGSAFRHLAYVALAMYFIYISEVVPALTNTKQAAAVTGVGFGLWTLSLAITEPAAMIYHQQMLFTTSPGGAGNALTYNAASDK